MAKKKSNTRSKKKAERVQGAQPPASKSRASTLTFTAPIASAPTTRPSPAPASAGAFTLCLIDSGPQAGKVMVRNISGQSVAIDGHTTFIRFQLYKSPPPARLPLGPYSASVNPGDHSYQYLSTSPPVILSNPCVADGEPVKLTLVVHHIFEPIHGGVVQVLCEKIEKEFACPIGNCGPEVA